MNFHGGFHGPVTKFRWTIASPRTTTFRTSDLDDSNATPVGTGVFVFVEDDTGTKFVSISTLFP